MVMAHKPNFYGFQETLCLLRKIYECETGDPQPNTTKKKSEKHADNVNLSDFLTVRGASTLSS